MYLGEEFEITKWFVIHFTENNGWLSDGIRRQGRKNFSESISNCRFIGDWLVPDPSDSSAYASYSDHLFLIHLRRSSRKYYRQRGVRTDVLWQHGWCFRFLPAEGGYAGFLHGRVVDMLYFPLMSGRFPDWLPIWGGDTFLFFRPVFNIADSSISIGVFSLLFFKTEFLPRWRKRRCVKSESGRTCSWFPAKIFRSVVSVFRNRKTAFLFSSEFPVTKKLILLFLSAYMVSVASAQNSDSAMIRKIYSEILVNGKAYTWLRGLSVDIGGRLSGSQEAEKAVQYAERCMKQAGADSVWLQETWVPHWVRGMKESGKIIDAKKKCAGCSCDGVGRFCSYAGTGELLNLLGGAWLRRIEKGWAEKDEKAKLFLQSSFLMKRWSTLLKRTAKRRSTRWSGPSEAAKYGAIATICRSMTNATDDFPHTGAMGYADSLPKLPCAAISTNGADLLSRVLRSNPSTQFFSSWIVRSSIVCCRIMWSEKIRGTEHPEEIIWSGTFGFMGNRKRCAWWRSRVSAGDGNSARIQSLNSTKENDKSCRFYEWREWIEGWEKICWGGSSQ